MKIPEYYKQFQNTNVKKPDEDKKKDEILQEQQSESKQNSQHKEETPNISQSSQVKEKTIIYQGNGFSLNQLEDWEDKTIYTLTGPATDGVQHNILITVDKENPFDTLEEYAEWHIKTLETDLKSCMILKKGETNLTNGTEAYEAIFSWYPTDDLRIYQHQIFIQFEKAVYKLTSSFTKKTRQTLGPQVLRMMLSFTRDQK